MLRTASIAVAMLAVIPASPAHASVLIVPDSGDSGWLLASMLTGLAATITGILMLFAAVYGRDHFARLLSAMGFAAAMVTLLTFIIGYSLMFDTVSASAVSGFVGGGTHVMLNLMGTLREGTTVAETAFVAFQLGFVLVAVALLVGPLAPRARPGWLLGFVALWYLLVLVPVTRWIWGGGWLAGFGTIDVAGGLTIFTSSAVSALVAMAMVGSADDAVQPDEPGLQGGGAALLLLGMLALAGGATLGAGDNAAVAMLSLLACTATATLLMALFRRRLDTSALVPGVIAGTMAMMTAGDGFSTGGAILTGVMAALAAVLAPRLLPQRLAWHDKGGLMATMLFASLSGAVLTAIFIAFVPFGGSGYPADIGMAGQIAAQVTGILAVALWSMFGTVIAALMMGMVVPMRATPARPAAGSGLDQP